MMALPAMVLEAEVVVSTASAGACTLTSGDAGTSRSAGGRSHLPAGVAALARRLAPDGFARGSECDWLPLASASPRRSEMGYHLSLVRTLLGFCSLKG